MLYTKGNLYFNVSFMHYVGFEISFPVHGKYSCFIIRSSINFMHNMEHLGQHFLLNKERLGKHFLLNKEHLRHHFLHFAILYLQKSTSF